MKVFSLFLTLTKTLSNNLKAISIFNGCEKEREITL